ncbi:MAG: hypothetical protein LC660_02500 [Desulfobacteraceae bacterium]|nr:hypothetical protein [Desulfobacteraceae bacterium]
MKDGVKAIVGKTISSVVVGCNQKDPQNQVFLVFDDGTHFEFWGPNFSCAGGVDIGDQTKVINYIKKLGGSVTKIHPR